MANKNMAKEKEKKKALLRDLRLKEKAKVSALKFKRELKKSSGTAIVAAFSFLIALSWRDVIKEYVDNIVKITPLQGKLFSAILITIVCVIGILIVTKIISKEKI